MVLGPPRLHYTAATGGLTTKSGAAAHALRSFPAHWHGLVRDALAIHHRRATAFGAAGIRVVQAAIADFIGFVIADAHTAHRQAGPL